MTTFRTFVRLLTMALTGALVGGLLTLAAIAPARADTGPATDQQTQITCDAAGTTTTTVYLQQSPDGSWFVVDTVTATSPGACAVIDNGPVDLSHVVRTEGNRSRGFKVIMDNGTNVLYPRLRHMQWVCNRDHGVNTEAAATCRAEWRATYTVFVERRS